MTDLHASADRPRFGAMYGRHGWLLVCALPVITALAVRGPMPVDETRYLSVAWEMWHQGDFLVPALNGAPYTHKPPVLFWLMHLGWWLFGVNAWWPRLIPFFAAIAAVLLTQRLVARLYPEPLSRASVTAAWLLAGTFAWTTFATVLLFDMLLVVWVLAAIVALEDVERAPRSSWCAYAGAVAAGLLTKGPVMLIFTLPAALLGPWWSLGAQRHKTLWYGGLSLALLAALGIAGMWALCAYEAAGEAFIRAILWDQTATRVLDSVAHARPWWFYVAVFPCCLLPWLLWPTSWRSVHMRGTPRADRLAFATFVPTTFVLFSFISGKQPHYLLPLVPITVLWLAPRVAQPAMKLADATPAIRRLALANATTVACVTIAFVLSAGPAYDLHSAAAVLRRLDEQEQPLAWVGPYDGQVNFVARLRHPVTELDRDRPEQVAAWIATHHDGELLIYTSGTRATAIGTERYGQRYRSGWLAIVPSTEAGVASRIAGTANAGVHQTGGG